MDVQPDDQVLEIGCGPGAGAELICAKLETGKLFAIDRSESGVDRTKRRNQKYVEAGRLTVRQIDLATLRVPVKRLNKVFAFNVNLFWVRDCDDEVALLHERVVPGGRGLPLLRGQPPRAGAQHRQEGLRGPRPGRLPGLRRRAEGPRRIGIIGRALRRRSVVVGPDDDASISGWANSSAATGDVVEGDRVDPGDHLVDGEQLVVDELGLADARHPGAGVLEAEHQAAAQLALAALELLLGDAVGGDLGQLGAHDLEHLVELAGQAADRDADQAGVGVVAGEGVDGVGQAARSRTSWNSRDDVPPPRAVLSTPRAKRRSSCGSAP